MAGNKKHGLASVLRKVNVAGGLSWYSDGHVYCNETDRVVAKFSHVGDAKGYCELLQKVQQLKVSYHNAVCDQFCDVCSKPFLECEC